MIMTAIGGAIIAVMLALSVAIIVLPYVYVAYLAHSYGDIYLLLILAVIPLTGWLGIPLKKILGLDS